jgi:hypothetical protein
VFESSLVFFLLLDESGPVPRFRATNSSSDHIQKRMEDRMGKGLMEVWVEVRWRFEQQLGATARNPTGYSTAASTSSTSYHSDISLEMAEFHPDSIRNDTDSKTLSRLSMMRTKDRDLVILLGSIQTACKLIARSVRKAGIAGLCKSDRCF